MFAALLMALSSGFINLFIKRKCNKEECTPVLKVEHHTAHGWSLSDGESNLEFFFNPDSGPKENLGEGVRVILEGYYLSENKKISTRRAFVTRFLLRKYILGLDLII